jgi:uncharacterized protein YjbI with pentapeptide repeats
MEDARPFAGHPEDLAQFEKLIRSPIRSEEREQALHAWETYKLGRQAKYIRKERPDALGGKSGDWNKGEYIQSLTAPAIQLQGGRFTDVILGYADLRGVQLDGAVFDLHERQWMALKGSRLTSASLCDVVFPRGARCMEADLTGAEMDRAQLVEADFRGGTAPGSSWIGANLQGAVFYKVSLYAANMESATLVNADLSEAALNRANLTGADLTGASLRDAMLPGATLRGANLTGCDLSGASLVGADLTGAILNDARIYGISAWDVQKENLQQENLIVTPQGEPDVSVADLEVAQFIYLLMKNERIRDVITTVTSKSVLILGRFYEERKVVLDAVKWALRERGLVPIIFDWPKSPKRDLTETVQLLANMSRFVVAVRPIILASKCEYAMFEHWSSYVSVLPDYKYENKEQLIRDFDTAVLDPIKRWEEATDKANVREAELLARIAELEREREEQG